VLILKINGAKVLGICASFGAETVAMMISPGLIGCNDLWAVKRILHNTGIPALHGIIGRYNNSASRGASLIFGIPQKKRTLSDSSTHPGAISFLGE
jgi:hypothetical protein